MSHQAHNITKYQFSKDVSKSYQFVDGKLIGAAQHPTAFTALKHSVNLQSLAEMLDSIGPKEGFGLGLYKEDVVKGVPKGQAGTGGVTRSKDHCSFSSGPSFMLIDVDDVPETVKSESDMLDHLTKASPSLANCGMVIRRSSSAGICGHEIQKTDLKWHIYIPVLNGTDIPRATKALFKRLWLVGMGRILVSADGKLLERSIIDASVASPERIIFEAAPILPDGFSRPNYKARVIDGPALNTTEIKDLSNDESSQYEALVDEAKIAAAPDAEKAFKRRVKKVSKEQNVSEEKAKAIVKARQDGVIAHDAPIKLANGETVTAYEAMLKNPYSYCHDPSEPHKGPQKAYIFPNLIYSHLHGGVKYKIEDVELYCKDTTDLYWSLGKEDHKSHRESLRGKDLARWAYVDGKRHLWRFGVDLSTPALFLKGCYPDLDDHLTERVCSALNHLWEKRRIKSISPLRLSHCDLYLERDSNDQIAWERAIQATKEHKLIATRSQHGSGKTSVFAKHFATGSTSFLGVAHLVKLTHQMAETLDTDHYKDEPFNRVKGRLTTCLPSLTQQRRVTPYTLDIKTLLIDEAGQLRRALAELKDCAYFSQTDIYDELARLCSEADKVILLDADLCDEDIKFYEGLSRCKGFIIDTQPSRQELIATVKSGFFTRGGIASIADHIKKGQACSVCCSSKEYARLIFNEICSLFPEKDIRLYANAPEVKDGDMSVDSISQADCVIYTSMMGTGFSITSERFTKCFGYFSQSPLSPADCIQMLRRFRAVRDFEISITLDGSVKDAWGLSQNTSGLQGLRDRVAAERIHHKAYFATALCELLRARGFVFDCRSSAFWNDKAKELRESDADHISLARPVNPNDLINDSSRECLSAQEQYFGIHAHKARTIFSVPKKDKLTKELALAYVLDAHRLHRYWSIVNSHEHEWGIARAIFSLMLKERLSVDDCKKILNEVRKHSMALKRIHALPERWAARNVPTKNAVGNTVELIKHWGLESESKRSDGSYFASVSISDVSKIIYSPLIESKANKKSRALELIAQGMPKKQVAVDVGVSERTVFNWSKDAPAKQYQNRQEGYTPLSDDNGTVLQYHRGQEKNTCLPGTEKTHQESCKRFHRDSLDLLTKDEDIQVLAADHNWLKGVLRCRSDTKDLLAKYKAVWLDAMKDLRLSSHQRQNSGRKAANRWISTAVWG